MSLHYVKTNVIDVYYASREPKGSVWYDEKRYAAMFSDAKIERVIFGLQEEIQTFGSLGNPNIDVFLSRLFRQFLASCGSTEVRSPRPKGLLRRFLSRSFRVLSVAMKTAHLNHGPCASLCRGGVGKAFLDIAVLELQQVEQAVSELASFLWAEHTTTLQFALH